MTGQKTIALFSLALLGLAVATLPAHAQGEYETTLARAHKLMKGNRDHDAALEAYQAAEALTDSPIELLSGASGAAVGVQDYKLATEYCRRAIPVAQSDEERGMAWPQLWDGQRSLSVTRLLAKSYPTYIVVDHDSVIRYTTSGWSDQVGSTLDLKVRTALKAARKAAKKL